MAARDRAAFAVLDELLARTPRLPEPLPGCGFTLGWVGFLGYELGREVDGPDRSASGHADADRTRRLGRSGPGSRPRS